MLIVTDMRQATARAGASAWDKNGKKTLDGTVAPGKKLSGVIVYEVAV